MDQSSLFVRILLLNLVAGVVLAAGQETRWQSNNNVPGNFHTSNTQAKSEEHEWIADILDPLFNELADSKFQLSPSRTVLADWWLYVQPHGVTISNFPEFWTRFGAGVTLTIGSKPVDKYLQLVANDPVKLAALNELLGTTLGLNECHVEEDGGSVVIAGSFVSVEYIKQCVAEAAGGEKELIIFAYHTFLMDDDLSARKANGTNVLIVAPNIVAVGAGQRRVLNLQGVDGEEPSAEDEFGSPGKPGWKAGNAFIVTRNLTGGLGPSLSGGAGGVGQAGAVGTAGQDGVPFFFSVESDEKRIVGSQCTAWSGGGILVHVQPHWCAPPKDGGVQYECHADDNGAKYRMFGSVGGSGGSGGDGGAGGLGGFGGTYTLINVEDSVPVTASGDQGPTGLPGLGGEGGEGGRNGSTVELWIDDIWVVWPFSKVCEIVSTQGVRPVDTRGPRGNPGRDGANSVGIEQPIPNDFNPAIFQPRLQDFVQAASEALREEEFLRPILEPFLELMKNNSNIPV